MDRPVKLRTSLSRLGGNAEAYLEHHEKNVVEAVGYNATMRINPSSGAELVVEVEFWVPDDVNGVDVTKGAMLRASSKGFITEVIVIPAPPFPLD